MINKKNVKFILFLKNYAVMNLSLCEWCTGSGQIKKIKSLLYSLNTLSGDTSEQCPSPQLCTKANTSRLQQWRVVGSMWEI